MVRQHVKRPARVLQDAQAALFNPPLARPTKPVWLRAAEQVTPSEIRTRPYLPQHQPLDPRQKKPRNLYKPTRITFPEDQLRQNFYRDHPWELAQPMLVLETNGMDARFRDWSTGVKQPGMKLSGECVVQRQMWLMDNQGLAKNEAYDIARREFYKLRNQEQIEARIAIEEARMVGAYFGKSLLQVGMELEGREYERWKAWAEKQIHLAQNTGKTLEHEAEADQPVVEELVEGEPVAA